MELWIKFQNIFTAIKTPNSVKRDWGLENLKNLSQFSLNKYPPAKVFELLQFGRSPGFPILYFAFPSFMDSGFVRQRFNPAYCRIGITVAGQLPIIQLFEENAGRNSLFIPSIAVGTPNRLCERTKMIL